MERSVSERAPPSRASRAVRLASWLAPLADAFVATTMLRGVAAGSDQPLTMLVAGPLSRVQWLVERAFDGTPRHETLGHLPGWRLRTHAAADAGIGRPRRRAHGARVRGPARLRRRLAARSGLDRHAARGAVRPGAIARLNHSVGDDIRRTRRDWTAEETHRGDDFRAFYRDMYVPFIRRRHARRCLRALGASIAPSVSPRRSPVGASDAGSARRACCSSRRHGTLAAVALGVSGGDDAWLRAGAVAALYVHLIELARTSGCTSIDWRGSRPSLADGVTRFKRKWGAVVYDRPQVLHTTLLHWDRMSPAVLAFLERTPLVFHDVDGLSALVATRADLAPAPSQAFAQLGIPGLRRLVLLATSLPASERAVDGRCVPLLVSAVDAGPRALRAAMRASIAVGADG